jgi:hypothetical protein
MERNRLKFGLLAGAAVAGFAVGSFAQATAGSAADAKFDASRLRTGQFTYRTLRDGREASKFILTIRKLADGSFRFTGEASDLSQRWESVATTLFKPISAALHIERSDHQLYDMRLNYASGRVTGSTTITAAHQPKDSEKPDSTPLEKAIDASVTNGTIDQRIDWAAILASSLLTGQKFDFKVFDPATGSSPVAAEVTEAKKIQVPAGTYESVLAVYRIEKTKGTETYKIWASRDLPRLMVREDFPNGMVTELVEVAETHESND